MTGWAALAGGKRGRRTFWLPQGPPAKACSTRTRMRPNFRLVRFSAAVNAPPAAFFFRLAGLHSGWLVSLEAAVLVQHGPRRIGDPLVVGDALVRCPADVGAAQ